MSLTVYIILHVTGRTDNSLCHWQYRPYFMSLTEKTIVGKTLLISTHHSYFDSNISKITSILLSNMLLICLLYNTATLCNKSFEPCCEKTGFLYMKILTKTQISFAVTRKADQRLCFRYTDSTIPVLPKYKSFG